MAGRVRSVLLPEYLKLTTRFSTMRATPVLLIALVLSACTTSINSDDDPTVSTVPVVEDASPDSDAVAMPSQIDTFRVKQVQVGDRTLTLAIADNPTLRRQGLQGVTDLEDLDGMLFFWRHDGDPFWMKDTLIPLDIVWFNEDGTFKGRDSMVPCTADPCPTHQPDNLDFRYAIEAPPGTLDWITDDTVIIYTDD
jgi:uncharacterized membrane protein (UPF0127 family)